MEENKITFEDIQKANETIKPLKIKKKNKETNKTEIKNYAEVNQRVKAFRMVYPAGAIITELISDFDGICTFKAKVMDGNGYILAIAHARENNDSSFINRTNAIENCETSAVGRALGMCGFGIDVSLASAEEIQNSLEKQAELENESMTVEQMNVIASLDIPLKEQLRKVYKKDPVELTKQEAENAINSLIKNKLLKTEEQIEKEKKEKEEVF